MSEDSICPTSKCGVYTITNVADEHNTVYVGGTITSFKLRWRHHINRLQNGEHGNSHLQRAWDKYGKDSFEFVILEIVADPDRVNKREQYWLDLYQDTRRVYNIASTVGRPPQHPFSEETRRKIGAVAEGRVMTEETKRKISTALKGREFSEEHKRKIGEANRGREHTEAAKRRMSIAHRGHTPTEETRRKMSLAHKGQESPMKGKTQTPEARQKISTALKGRKFSEEHKQKIAAALQGRRISEEAKQKISDANARPYPAFINPETGEVIPSGRNLKALCEKHGLSRSRMWDVMEKNRTHHKGWVLLKEDKKE